jgi:serine phosphatase RsbU (regulator of sigma subunit)
MSVLERFAATLEATDQQIVTHINAYIDWMVGRQNDVFTLTDDDEVDLRAYLFHLRMSGVKRKALRQHFASLNRFYDWAEAEGLITENPFANQAFDRPFLNREEIRRRKEQLPADPQAREIAHLRALNELAQHLNRAPDIQTALNVTLETLIKVMKLHTAWVFLLPELYHQLAGMASQPPHDFALAAACNLPPGLELKDRLFLCQPPDCHCQVLARKGRLTRAFNVVECTRLQDSARADGENRGLYFHATVPIIISNQMQGIINVATDEWQFFTSADLQFLSTVGVHVSAALERAGLYDLTRTHRERLERELEMARQVQVSLLPGDLPPIPGFELAAQWHAAREVAGDFYDVFPLADGRWGFVVADVSDKGAPAALYMAMVRSLIRSNASRQTSPAATLMRVNADIMAHSSSDMFVTIFYGILDPGTAVFTYAGAGHDPPLLRRASGEIERLMPTGPLVGILKNLVLQEAAVELAADDLLLLYTDGVTDALSEAGEEYRRSRLIKQLETVPGTAVPVLSHIYHDLMAFIGTAPQPDDITLLALSYAGAPPK